MRFLLNDALLDIGEPQRTLAETECPVAPDRLRKMSRAELLSLVQGVFFLTPDFVREKPDKAVALAALVYLKTDANALLCVRTPQVKVAGDMPVRLAQMSLQVVADLARRENEGNLTPEAVDRAVWAAV
jgi:hypothetical protein